MEHYDELMDAFNKWGEPLYESVAMGVVVGNRLHDRGDRRGPRHAPACASRAG